MKPYDNIETIDDVVFNDDTNSFNLNINRSAKLILLRTIIGSTKIKHNLSQTEFSQSTDYLDLEGRNSAINPLERLKNYVSDDITIMELGRVFSNRKFLYQNNAFFERLVQEFNNYYHYENKGSHTTAFAFIYRILETISYAMPLIYVSKTTDFAGTYTSLKDFLSGNKDKGELGFFKSFIKAVFKDDPIFESSITIEIIADSEEIQQKFFNSFNKACPQDIFDATDTVEPSQLSVKFSDYSSFIISLRNRFFHLFNSGLPNLQSDDIIDADYFFKLVNRKSMYWISLVIIEIFKHNIPIDTEE